MDTLQVRRRKLHIPIVRISNHRTQSGCDKLLPFSCEIRPAHRAAYRTGYDYEKYWWRTQSGANLSPSPIPANKEIYRELCELQVRFGHFVDRCGCSAVVSRKIHCEN